MFRRRLTAAVHRWTASGLSADDRQRLAERIGAAREKSVLDAVHDEVRNSARLHSWVHLRLVLSFGPDADGTRLVELERLLAAPVSSVGRRLGGCPPDAPQDPGLKVTWQRAFRAFLDAQDSRHTGDTRPMRDIGSPG